ncbi:putative bifunctional diguanylate cyclase/phosphodiesterase [Hahella ganghwensis]|uniref:putative bifunctional diguanylate cyclase/phosphodiesterase n=1 Tax=Hahella ganghwensis TaxID=286420 RepID=UPI0003812C8F|nr:EAL domain-containing protein [Hahella ganghwensis]
MGSLQAVLRTLVYILLPLVVAGGLIGDYFHRKAQHQAEVRAMLKHLGEDLSHKVSVYEKHHNLITGLFAETLNDTKGISSFQLPGMLIQNQTDNTLSADIPNSVHPQAKLVISGDFEGRSKGFYREINTALALTDALNSSIKSLTSLSRAYYFSREEFIYTLPASASKLPSTKGDSLVHAFYDLARPYQNPRHILFWTQTSIDVEKSRLLATMVKPVYNQQSLQGLLAMEVNVTHLIQQMPGNIGGTGALLLVDNGNLILNNSIYKTGSASQNLSFIDLLPESVANFVNHPFDIPDNDFTSIKNVYVVRESLEGPPWHMVLVLPKSELSWSVLKSMWQDILTGLLMLMMGLLVYRHWSSRQALQVSQHHHYAIFEQSTAPQLIVDEDGIRILRANQAACDLFGFTRQMLEDIPLTNLIIGNASAQELSNSLSEKGLSITKCRVADGEERDIEIYKSTMQADEDIYFYLVIHDISERVKTEQHVRFQAYFDPLTQLPNRNHLFEHLRQLIASHRREDQYFALLFIDLDHFKQVNDNLGHEAGDKVLQHVAHRLRDRLRESDLLSRLGGDEFTVVLPHLRNEMDASHVARTLINQLHEPFTIDSYEVVLGASIGITLFPRDGVDPSSLLKHSDIAMYKAKDNGRNQFRFFEDQMNREAKHRGLLEIDIQKAVQNQQLMLEYQPIIEAASGQLVGVEALIRWNHPRLGVLKPEDFILVAEDTGHIVAIGDWVLKQTHQLYQSILAQLSDDENIPFISINISRRQLMHEHHLKHWKQILDLNDRFAEFVLLDMTETTLTSQIWDERFGLNSLLALGPRICLDDFGQNTSSLRVLRQYPISMLKVDKALIKNILSTKTDAAFCRAIISLAKNMDIRVSAEGVESKDQLEWLREAGCDYVQGYYVGEELSGEDILSYLDKQTA